MRVLISLLLCASAFAEVRETKTAEGMTVWVAPRPGVPKLSATLVVRGGAAGDPRGLEGMSELFAYTIAEGTRSKSAEQLAQAAQSLGGELRVDFTPDAIVISASALSDGADKLIELMADLALNATFPEKEVALVKANTLEQLAEKESTADFIGEKTFASALFGTHPYRTTHAQKSVVQAVTPEILRREYARRFHPDRALLIVAGNVEPAEIAAAAKRSFAGWKPSSEPAPPLALPTANVARKILLVDRPESTQAHIRVGRLAPRESDPEFFATVVGNAIFGGMTSARVLSNLREDKGFSYSPSSQLLALERTGVLQLIADARTEVAAPTLVEAFYELDRMWASPPTEEELARAKKFAAGSFLVRSQVPEAYVDMLAREWIQGRPAAALEEYVSRIETVKLDEVRKICGTQFPSWSQTVVVVGDAAKLAGELARFGQVSVVKP
jgi:predicted Zn-dependent peptidase